MKPEIILLYGLHTPRKKQIMQKSNLDLKKSTMLLWLISLLVLDCPMCEKIVPPNTLTVTSEWRFFMPVQTDYTKSLARARYMCIISAMEIVFYVTGLLEERMRSILNETEYY